METLLHSLCLIRWPVYLLTSLSVVYMQLWPNYDISLFSAVTERNISGLSGCRRGNCCEGLSAQLVGGSNTPTDHHTPCSLTGGLLTVFSDPVGYPGAAEWAEHSRPSTSRGVHNLLVSVPALTTCNFIRRSWVVGAANLFQVADQRQVITQKKKDMFPALSVLHTLMLSLNCL